MGSFGTDAVNENSILKKGILRIPYATVARAGLGSVASENFQLWRDGEEVPLYVSKGSGTVHKPIPTVVLKVKAG